MTRSLLTLLLLVAAPLAGARAAPAPFPPRRPFALLPAHVVGTWRATFCGVPWLATFHRGGYYSCLYQGHAWEGTWSVRGGELIFCERLGGGQPVTFRTRLDRHLRGKDLSLGEPVK